MRILAVLAACAALMAAAWYFDAAQAQEWRDGRGARYNPYRREGGEPRFYRQYRGWEGQAPYRWNRRNREDYNPYGRGWRPPRRLPPD